MYALMSLQISLLIECLTAHITGVLALLLKGSESTCKIAGKNMRIQVGRYLGLKPQSSEMFGWYGERGKRGYRKEGGFGLTWKLWNIFPATQFL
jgi:hypothetical protein